jgi:hypothetical protein
MHRGNETGGYRDRNPAAEGASEDRARQSWANQPEDLWTLSGSLKINRNAPGAAARSDCKTPNRAGGGAQPAENGSKGGSKNAKEEIQIDLQSLRTDMARSPENAGGVRQMP